jgi:hypothetical protein
MTEGNGIVRETGRCAELVLDALLARHMEGRGCFLWNQSCRLLQGVGVPALPVIEAVILNEVLPFYHCPTESLDRKFPGLLSLLVTYFAIGKDGGAGRVLKLFHQLYGSLRVEAIRAINVVWLCRAPTAALPEPLRVTIRKLAEEGSGEVREAARWLLEQAAE